MLDNRVARVAMVFAALGGLVFLFAGAGITDENRGTLLWVGVGGLLLGLLAGLVLGLVWALRPAPAVGQKCDTCEGVGFTEPAAFMTPDGEVPPRCPDCGGSGQAPRCALHAAPSQEHAPASAGNQGSPS